MKEVIRQLRQVTGLDVSHEASASVKKVVERADQEGLVDVAWKRIDSPVGPLILANTEVGLMMVSYEKEGRDTLLFELAERASPRILHCPSRLDSAHRELDEYFGGQRHRFDLRIDWRLVRSGFKRAVLEATGEIPYAGSVTYREIAVRAGNERASRAAGNALGSNPLCIVIPCHRVLKSDGGLGGYRGGVEKKRLLLDLENKHFRRRK